MASKLGSGEDEPIVDINVTPLVDIVLVVLIIFMVAAPLMEKSIKVTLPEAATGEENESTSLGLTLTSDGTLYLDGTPIDETTLRESIRREKAQNDDVTCLIAADADVSHGRVVWLIDLVKQEGVVKFAINIDPAAVKAGAEPDPAPKG